MLYILLSWAFALIPNVSNNVQTQKFCDFIKGNSVLNLVPFTPSSCCNLQGNMGNTTYASESEEGSP